MKLTDLVKTHGWDPYPVGPGYKNLKVYSKPGYLLGVQKIGNVYRVDAQQTMELGGTLLPISKALDNQIIAKEQLEPAIKALLLELA